MDEAASRQEFRLLSQGVGYGAMRILSDQIQKSMN